MRVPDPDWYHDFSTRTPGEWQDWFTRRVGEFDASVTVLPQAPDVRAVEGWLLRVRDTR